MMEYKTARLMQLSLVGSAALIKMPKNRYSHSRILLDLFKVGYHLGVMFQLFDDLCDLFSQNESTHEKAVNAFIHFPLSAEKQLINSIEQLKILIEKHSMLAVQVVLQDYLDKVVRELHGHSTLPVNEIFLQEGLSKGLSLKPIFDRISPLHVSSSLNSVN